MATSGISNGGAAKHSGYFFDSLSSAKDLHMRNGLLTTLRFTNLEVMIALSSYLR